MDIRDSSGISQFVELQSGSAIVDDRLEVSIFYTPETSGEYEMRTFLITDLHIPKVLSEIKSTRVVIN